MMTPLEPLPYKSSLEPLPYKGSPTTFVSEHLTKPQPFIPKSPSEAEQRRQNERDCSIYLVKTITVLWIFCAVVILGSCLGYSMYYIYVLPSTV